MLIWSILRILRALGGLYESQLFFGMSLGLKNEDYNNIVIPMALIVIFIVLEIAPFLYVLDWNFMEIFIIKQFPVSAQEPLFEN